MPLVPDQRAVEQLAAAGPHPAFHDRIHPRHLDTATHDLDPRVGQNGVEQRRVLPIAVSDQVPDVRLGVVQVHDEVAGGLGDPRCSWVGGGAEDADAAGGVLDDGEDVQGMYMRAPVSVTVSMKSAASSASAWERAEKPEPVDLTVLPPFFNDLLGELPWWKTTWQVTQVEPAYPREVASNHDRQKNRFTEVSVPGTLGGDAGQTPGPAALICAATGRRRSRTGSTAKP
jgi:hypothetical protein